MGKVGIRHGARGSSGGRSRHNINEKHTHTEWFGQCTLRAIQDYGGLANDTVLQCVIMGLKQPWYCVIAITLVTGVG